MDASALGAVITQNNRPIAFYSRKLSKMQQKYSVTEIELLAIVETLKEFKGMLWGQDIKVFTDHKNLTRDALGLTSDRVYRWQLLLEEYAPKIIYIKCEDSYMKSLCCDSAFAHKKKFSIFKFPERFLEIPCAEISLLS